MKNKKIYLSVLLSSITLLSLVACSTSKTNLTASNKEVIDVSKYIQAKNDRHLKEIQLKINEGKSYTNAK